MNYDRADLLPPSDLYHSTQEYTEAARLNKHNGLYYSEIHPAHELYYPLPQSLDRGIHWIFRTRFRHNMPASFVAILPAGRVWGPYGAIITPDNRLLGDVSYEFYKTAKDHSIFQKKKLPRATFIAGSVAVTASPGSWNYFHWLFDVLPRLELLRLSGIVADKYVMDYQGYPFQRETIARLGIEEKNIIRSHPKLHLKAERLIVPSMPCPIDYVPPKWACDFLRRELLVAADTTNAEAYERIYISRPAPDSRRIRNEAELISLLHGFGFKDISLSRLSVTEQARIFSAAKIIIAPHGAGLTNLVFCKPGTKIIELFSPEFLRVTFCWIAHHMNLDYYYLIGAGERPPEEIDPYNCFAHFEVSCNPADLVEYFRIFSRISQPLASIDANKDEDWQKIAQIDGWLLQTEAVALQWLVRQLPVSASVVELGSFMGRNSAVIASALPSCSLLYCTGFSTAAVYQAELLKSNLAKLDLGCRIQVLTLDTIAAAEKFAAHSLDLVFVDAERDYQSIRTDIINWYPKLKTGGYMLFHDYGWWPGVKEAIDSVSLTGFLIADSLWLHRKETEKDLF